jgi:hypothetical protein
MNNSSTTPMKNWRYWLLLVVFIFIAFEAALLAAALKGSWFILLGPAIVCTHKALETWREMNGKSADQRTDLRNDLR